MHLQVQTADTFRPAPSGNSCLYNGGPAAQAVTLPMADPYIIPGQCAGSPLASWPVRTAASGSSLHPATGAATDVASSLILGWPASHHSGLAVDRRHSFSPANSTILRLGCTLRRATWERDIQVAQRPNGPRTARYSCIRSSIRCPVALRTAGFWGHGSVMWLSGSRLPHLLLAVISVMIQPPTARAMPHFTPSGVRGLSLRAQPHCERAGHWGHLRQLHGVSFRSTWGHRFSAKVVHVQRWRTGNSSE